MPSKNIIRFLRFTMVGFSSYFSIFLFYLCFEEIIFLKEYMIKEINFKGLTEGKKSHVNKNSIIYKYFNEVY